ncbi:MAG: rRNA pseudouridine synthase [Nanoarchaeota archaeon]|nr:rRNA pseudouridine synthase [Nanoarchaeota archaeon]
MEEERVQKFIALSGLTSRRKSEDLIKQNKVKVNGKIIKLGDKCLATDKIEVNNKQIYFNTNPGSHTYIILNKKAGFVCSKEDKFNKKTVYDLIKKENQKSNLFTIGRLDKETEGLLLLTTDGDLTQRIIHPSSKIKKEYLVKLNKKLQKNHKEEIEKGLVLDNYKLSSCEIKNLNNNDLIITINEGKKRQIRRIFEMKNYSVTKLIRTKIGNLNLNDLNLKLGDSKLVEKDFLERKIFSQ